jgi:alkanesulfonate monooxygenase SsuD/methylene tetrahydromethanopterin reductase-like flavin-dependent oxidoreductase (luciferase family)
VGPEGFREGLTQVRRHAEDAGRDPDALGATAYLFAAIGRQEGEAAALLGAMMQTSSGCRGRR